jgi:hypothetical protein
MYARFALMHGPGERLQPAPNRENRPKPIPLRFFQVHPHQGESAGFSLRPFLRFLAENANSCFQRRGDRAMSVHDGRGTKPLPEREISLEH